jgi:hypothetical protein
VIGNDGANERKRLFGWLNTIAGPLKIRDRAVDRVGSASLFAAAGYNLVECIIWLRRFSESANDDRRRCADGPA